MDKKVNEPRKSESLIHDKEDHAAGRQFRGVLGKKLYRKLKKEGVIKVGVDFTGTKKFTVPGQSMPMREVVNRFLLGQSLPISRMQYYDGDENNLDFDDYDRTLDPDFSYADFTELETDIAKRVDDLKRRKDKATFQEKARSNDSVVDETYEVKKSQQNLVESQSDSNQNTE